MSLLTNLTTGRPIKIYFSYANEDKLLLDKLLERLCRPQDPLAVLFWYSHSSMENHITSLHTADIIVILISPDYLASNELMEEMQQAIERDKRGEILIVPIILYPANWSQTPLKDFQALPTNGKPVTEWKDQAEAFEDITLYIMKQLALIWTYITNFSQYIVEGEYEISFLYAREDDSTQQEIEAHLFYLKQKWNIHFWSYRWILAGSETKVEVDKHLNSAHLLMLLISSAF